MRVLNFGGGGGGGDFIRSLIFFFFYSLDTSTLFSHTLPSSLPPKSFYCQIFSLPSHLRLRCYPHLLSFVVKK